MARDVNFVCDSSPLLAALNSLSEVAKTSREGVERFLDGLDSSSQLVRIDCNAVVAAGAAESRIVFQPSDLLVEFLAATGAGERDGLRI